MKQSFLASIQTKPVMECDWIQLLNHICNCVGQLTIYDQSSQSKPIGYIPLTTATFHWHIQFVVIKIVFVVYICSLYILYMHCIKKPINSKLFAFNTL